MSVAPGHILIVGGTRGLGRALAARCREAGERVSVMARRLPEEAMEGVACFQADVTDPTAVAKAVAAATERHGPLTSVALVQRHRGEGEDWEGEIATTLTAARIVVEASVPAFAPEGGAIVAMGSVAARNVLGEQSLAYHVARGGLEQLVRYYALTLAERGIRVNGVHSGSFLKPEAEEWYAGNEALRSLHTATYPLGRIPRAAEVAEVLRFLCGPSASMITGQHVVVDGGASLRAPEALARRIRQP